MSTETKECIEIDLSDEYFLILAKLAHEQDITLSKLIENILRKQMEEEEVK